MKVHKVNYADLPNDRTPALDYCRKLLADGTAQPEDRLEVFRTREEPDLIVKHIGKGATLSVMEWTKKRPYPHFVRFEPMEEEKRASLAFKRGK